MYWTSTPVPKDCDIWETCMWVCALPAWVNCAFWSCPARWEGIAQFKEVRSERWNWGCTLKKHTHLWRFTSFCAFSSSMAMCFRIQINPWRNLFQLTTSDPSQRIWFSRLEVTAGTTSKKAWIQVSQESPIRSCSGWFRCKMWTSVSQQPQSLPPCTQRMESLPLHWRFPLHYTLCQNPFRKMEPTLHFK